MRDDEHLGMVHTDDSAVERVELDRLRSYLDQERVVFAILFGSHARGTAGPDSDVDIALRFPETLDARERFRLRNQIDADLQQYAEEFVDVSDIEQLPTAVAHAALQDGLLLTGDEQAVETYHEQIEKEYESTVDERKRQQREFIDRVASGDV